MFTVHNLLIGLLLSCWGAFLLYHLASNKKKQEKLYQELEEVLGPEGRITEANHPSLRYLKVSFRICTWSLKIQTLITAESKMFYVKMIIWKPFYVNLAENKCNEYEFHSDKILSICLVLLLHSFPSFVNIICDEAEYLGQDTRVGGHRSKHAVRQNLTWVLGHINR